MHKNIFLFILALLLGGGCKKVTNVVGGDIVSYAELDYSKFHLKTSTEKIDSVETENVLVAMAGVLNDPLMGIIQCKTYSLWGFDGTNINFGTNPVLKSLKLNLYIATRYGDHEKPVTFKIYEITEDWDPNIKYTTRHNLNYNSAELLGSLTFSLPKDTVSKIISIPLDSLFGVKLLTAGSSNYTDAQAFQKFMKGLVIVGENSAQNQLGVVYSMIMTSLATNMEMVYQNDQGATDTFYFKVRSNADRYYTSLSQTLLGNEFYAQNKNNPDYFFLQPMTYLRAYLELPDRKDTTFIGKIVNKAVVEIYPVPQYNITEYNLNVPPAIHMYEIRTDSSGNTYTVGSSNFVYYDENKKLYTFDVTTYMQDYLKDSTKNNKLLLVPVAQNYSLNRGVFGGTTHPGYKPVLKVYYTYLNEE